MGDTQRLVEVWFDLWDARPVMASQLVRVARQRGLFRELIAGRDERGAAVALARQVLARIYGITFDVRGHSRAVVRVRSGSSSYYRLLGHENAGMP